MKLTRVLRFGIPYRASLAVALAFQLIETGAALSIPWVGASWQAV